MTAGTDHDDDPPDAICEDCGEPMDMTDLIVEAFEVTGRLICPACFAELHGDDDNEDEGEFDDGEA